jgi:hypothetical protein
MQHFHYKRSLISLLLVICLFVPANLVHADDGSQPQDTPQPEANQPVVDQPQTDSTPESTPVPTDQPATAAAPTVESTEIPADIETPQPPADESAAAIADTLQQNEAVVVDSNGNPVSLANQSVSDALSNPDPWIVRGAKTIRYLKDCSAYPDDANNECHISVTPVQAAIDAAAAGEVVHLGAGTFSEQLFITKSITLLGTTGSVIQAPSGKLKLDPTLNKYQPVIFIGNNANVVLDGLTVDGNLAGSDNWTIVGINIVNASGTIQNSVIKNITDKPLSGGQHGIGLYIVNNDGVDRTVTVQNSTIESYQKGGLVAKGKGLRIRILNNIFSGVGSTKFIAQNGIQLSDVSQGFIQGNTVTGNWYSPDVPSSWESAGIMVFSSNNVQIDSNEIFGNQICVYSSGNNVQITGNSIHHCNEALYIDASSSIQGNTITDSLIGVYTGDQTIPVNYNHFLRNDLNIYFDNTNTAPKLDATHNYWGSTLVADIESTLANLVSDGAYLYPYRNIDIGSPQTDPTAEPVNPITNPVVIQGEDPLIPVTGGLTALSCKVANTIQLPDLKQVTFTGILCDYKAGLQAETLDTLTENMKTDDLVKNFSAGMTISLVDKENNAVVNLPTGVKAVVEFPVSAEMKGRSYDILRWDPTANNGKGLWVSAEDVTMTEKYISGRSSVTGTFALVEKAN